MRPSSPARAQPRPKARWATNGVADPREAGPAAEVAAVFPGPLAAETLGGEPVGTYGPSGASSPAAPWGVASAGGGELFVSASVVVVVALSGVAFVAGFSGVAFGVGVEDELSSVVSGACVGGGLS